MIETTSDGGAHWIVVARSRVRLDAVTVAPGAMSSSEPAEAPGISPRRGRTGSLAHVILWVVLLAVAAGTAYQAAIALGIVGPGPAPGQTPAGDDLSFAAAFLALLGGGCALAVSSVGRRASERFADTRLLPLLSIAAACLVVARFYSYDPYYAPSLRRMSDGGLLPGRWIVAMVIFAAIAALVSRRQPRAGMPLTAAVMWLSAITAIAAGVGH